MRRRFRRGLRERNVGVDGTSTIDIIVAARDASATIGRAVGSALSQAETRCVWLIDDASRDGTAEAAAALFPAESRLKILKLPQNRGPAAARNIALELGDAEWIGALDADDFVVEGRLARLLARGVRADFIADDLLGSRDGGASWTPMKLVGDGVLDLETFVLGNVSRSGRIRRELGFLKPLMRRAFLTRKGLRYDESLRLGEDYILYARALAAGCRFATMSGSGYVAVERAGSLSGQHGTADLAALHRATWDLERLGSLSRSERRAVAAHRRSVRRKLDYRLALDAKGRGDYLGALAAALRRPDTTLHILGDIYRTARAPASS